MDKATLLTVKFAENLEVGQARKVLQIASDIFGLKYSGWSFPIEFFNRNEKLIRRVMKSQATPSYKPQVFYRGPRVSNNLSHSWSTPSMTRRCDAVAVVVPLGRRITE